MLDKDLERSLSKAYNYAANHRHEYMTVEHLLMALLDNQSAQKVLLACEANLELLYDNLQTFITDTTPLIPNNVNNIEVQPTLGFQRVLQRVKGDVW